MKKIIQMIYRLSGILLLLPACSEIERELPTPDVSANELQVNYTISGIEVQTYGVTALPVENRIEELYTLFFRSASDGQAPNQYVDFTRTIVTTSGTGKGTARIEMPNGEDVEKAWQVIFIANLERYANLEGSPNVQSWLTQKLKPNQVTGLTIEQARQVLLGVAAGSKGIEVSLPMSAEISKPAGISEVEITLTRRAARIDVSNTASGFELVNAHISNARCYTFLTDNGAVIYNNDQSQFASYTDQVVKASVTPDGQAITGGLYVFPNIVSIPAQFESQTTSLVFGGRYNGGTVSYYRVPVCAEGASQYLKGNGVYNVKIHAVSGPGSSTPETAVSGRITYTVNEWEEGYHTDYLFDKEGNGLALSQRMVTFSENGGQTVEIEVLRIATTLDPDNWNVGMPRGTDAAFFSASKKPGDTENRWVELTVPFDNGTDADREALVDINWGNLSIPVHLNQLSPTSRMDGILAAPNNIWFKPDGDTKELSLRILGDLTGITPTSITHTVLYEEGDAGWITQVAYNPSSSDPATGYYNYQITTSSMNLLPRQASIKFVVTQGERISTASVTIRQSRVDTGVNARRLVINVMEKTGADTYANRGVLTDWHANRIHGLPQEYQFNNHLVFPFVEHEQIIYRFTLVSAQDWKVVMPGETGQRLSSGITQAAGNPFVVHTFDIKAVTDVDDDWHGQFYLEFTDGTRFEYVVHQSGVIKTVGPVYRSMNYTDPDSRMIYYGTMWINNRLWLDRLVGASIGPDPDDPSIGVYSALSLLLNDERAKGAQIAYGDKHNACPAGFRPPKLHEAGAGEADWLMEPGNNLYYSINNPNVVPHAFIYFLILSNSPLKLHYWTIPEQTANFHIYDTGYYQIATNDTKNKFNTTTNYAYLRCIRNN